MTSLSKLLNSMYVGISEKIVVARNLRLETHDLLLSLLSIVLDEHQPLIDSWCLRHQERQCIKGCILNERQPLDAVRIGGHTMLLIAIGGCWVGGKYYRACRRSLSPSLLSLSIGRKAAD